MLTTESAGAKTDSVRHQLWLSLAKLSALVAILASSLLYVHYLDPIDSGLCGRESGCEAVRTSGASYFFVPYLNVPLLGMIAYGVVLLLALAVPEGDASRRRRPLLRLRNIAALGGVLALVLIIVQALIIKAFCWLCVVVDVAAVVAAFASIAAVQSPRPQRRLLERWAWGGLGVLAAASPLLYSWLKPPPPLPAAIREIQQPGKINVIAFADFECPWCRRLHPVLEQVLEPYQDRIHFQLLHAPLPGHPQSETAARAAVCAEQRGQGSAMADLLFAGALDEASLLEYANRLNIPADWFERCLNAPSTQARVEADLALLQRSDFLGLPTTYIGDERIVGARPPGVYRAALERAAHDDSEWHVSSSLLIWFGLGAALALIWTGARRNE